MTRSNMIKIEYVTGEDFREEVIESDIPVVMWLRGSWCGTCAGMYRMISQLADDLQGEIKFLCVDCPLGVDPDEHWLMDFFKIQRVPAFVFVKNGVVYGGHEGELDRTTLEELITKNITNR